MGRISEFDRLSDSETRGSTQSPALRQRGGAACRPDETEGAGAKAALPRSRAQGRGKHAGADRATGGVSAARVKRAVDLSHRCSEN